MASRAAGDYRLVWLQVRYQNKIFWRTPIAAFFTLAFPLMFLIVFTAVFGNDPIDDLRIVLFFLFSFFLVGLGLWCNISNVFPVWRELEGSNRIISFGQGPRFAAVGAHQSPPFLTTRFGSLIEIDATDGLAPFRGRFE